MKLKTITQMVIILTSSASSFNRGLFSWGWDIRSEARRQSEKQMNAFIEKTVFPQVTDRGGSLSGSVRDAQSP